MQKDLCFTQLFSFWWLIVKINNINIMITTLLSNNLNFKYSVLKHNISTGKYTYIKAITDIKIKVLKQICTYYSLKIEYIA